MPCVQAAMVKDIACFYADQLQGMESEQDFAEDTCGEYTICKPNSSQQEGNFTEAFRGIYRLPTARKLRRCKL